MNYTGTATISAIAGTAAYTILEKIGDMVFHGVAVQSRDFSLAVSWAHGPDKAGVQSFCRDFNPPHDFHGLSIFEGLSNPTHAALFGGGSPWMISTDLFRHRNPVTVVFTPKRTPLRNPSFHYVYGNVMLSDVRSNLANAIAIADDCVGWIISSTGGKETVTVENLIYGAGGLNGIWAEYLNGWSKFGMERWTHQ